MKQKNRSEYKKNKWRVEDIYPTIDDFYKELDSLRNLLPKYNSYKGKIMSSSSTLLEFLKFDVEYSKRFEDLYLYAHINNDSDTTNSLYQELYGKASNLYVEYSTTTSFIIPEILESDYSLVEKYIKECKELEDFRRNLYLVFRNKGHMLNKESEELLSNFGNVFSSPSEIQEVLTDSDMTFEAIKVNGKKRELTESNYSVYVKSMDENVRKSAFTNILEGYKKYNNTLSYTLKNEVELHKVNSRIRHYNNSLEASLYNNEVDVSVYKTLIDGVHKNLDTLYKYFDFKKRYLKLDEFHIYDGYVELNSEDDNKIKFEDALKLILDALKPLGDTYIKDLNNAFNSGWVDSINNKGKRGGAYSTSSYNTHPYVLMSYEETLSDVSTLAHEMGHAMHSYYSNKYQTYQDHDYKIFVAEVASQVNEVLLYRYLLDTSDNKEFKIKIIDGLLQKYKGAIYRQAMFSEFELFIHDMSEKGEILTKDIMNDKYYELNKLYFGPNVVVDDLIKYEWSRIPHFYYNFYVYQYSIGFAVSTYIANKIYSGDKIMRDNYLKFLSLGNSVNPIDSLRVCGVDVTREDYINDSIKYMKELISEINKLSR